MKSECCLPASVEIDRRKFVTSLSVVTVLTAVGPLVALDDGDEIVVVDGWILKRSDLRDKRL